MGAIITREDQLVAHSGGLQDAVWQEVIEVITENWERARRRPHPACCNRHLEIGEVLLYSIQTVEHLTLTLIFAADTSLKVIRKQAARLSETLNSVPPPDESVINAEPTIPMVIEPEAGQDIQPRRAARRRTPKTWKTSLTMRRKRTSQSPTNRSRNRRNRWNPPAVAPTKPKLRAEGAYTSYACVWLVERKKDAINATAAQLIESWLVEICTNLDWDLKVVKIQPEWLYVELEVPVGTLPSLIATTLMEDTAERALALDPSRSLKSPWSNGYLIRTPAESLQDNEINRFVDFYRSTQPSG